MEERELTAILNRILPEADNPAFFPFKHEEDDGLYDVWKVTGVGKPLVLKRAKEYEAEAYRTFFFEPCGCAPAFYGETSCGGEAYILLEYAEGENLQKCGRERLTLALDSLVSMQEKHWNDFSHAQACYTFEKSAEARRARRAYLRDPKLEAAYDRFMEIYHAVPRTLCHDDLLPFNVLVCGERAVMIDWEFCGILPYLSPLARLLAHGEERPDALFYLTENDRAFAVRYYFDHLAAKKGIPFAEYREALGYFLFYEYCEWVFVGNKYGDTQSEYFRRYSELAARAAEKLNG